jgi:hypothetical protein
MIREQARDLSAQIGLFPGIRVSATDQALNCAEVLFDSGIPVAEITMTVPNAIEIIRQIAQKLPEMVVGAGTVLDSDTARRCLDAGARFITSTGLVPEVVATTLKANVIAIPGALIPTEVIACWKAGGDFVKIFQPPPWGRSVSPRLVRRRRSSPALCFWKVNSLSLLRKKFRAVWPLLDERAKRLMAAGEARSLGYGGVSLVGRACGLSRKAVGKGIREIEKGTRWEGRIRRPGAGRKPITFSDPQVVDSLEAMVDETTRGDPESPLRWTCKSTRTLAAALSRSQHPVSHTKVAQILHHLNYSLQSNRKTEEGGDHPDPDAQFRYINNAVKRYLAGGWPVISVDTKKKELIGNYHNAGQQWHAKKPPRKVLGRAYPYGIYDIGRNTGFVNLGTDHDTGAFAVASIRGWWRHEGRRL